MSLRALRMLHMLHSKNCCRNFSVVKPSRVSPYRNVPDSIQKPPYAINVPEMPISRHDPEIKTMEQRIGMAKSCQLARKVLNIAKNSVQPGITTDEIDRIVHDAAISLDCYPSPLNYRCFPKSVCTSVNNVLCHGIPDERPLEEGDIVYHNGFHGDLSETIPVGAVDTEAEILMSMTKMALQNSIDACGPNVKYSVIGNTIGEVASMMDYSIAAHFIGHGIGSYFHGPPDIIHAPNDLPGEMKVGQTFTIEPILVEGSSEFKVLDDNWTAVTLDNSRSAQFEHTVLITENGAVPLTADNYDFSQSDL